MYNIIKRKDFQTSPHNNDQISLLNPLTNFLKILAHILIKENYASFDVPTTLADIDLIFFNEFLVYFNFLIFVAFHAVTFIEISVGLIQKLDSSLNFEPVNILG